MQHNFMPTMSDQTIDEIVLHRSVRVQADCQMLGLTTFLKRKHSREAWQAFQGPRHMHGVCL
jgi:hypothetical protein